MRRHLRQQRRTSPPPNRSTRRGHRRGTRWSATRVSSAAAGCRPACRPRRHRRPPRPGRSTPRPSRPKPSRASATEPTSGIICAITDSPSTATTLRTRTSAGLNGSSSIHNRRCSPTSTLCNRRPVGQATRGAWAATPPTRRRSRPAAACSPSAIDIDSAVLQAPLVAGQQGVRIGSGLLHSTSARYSNPCPSNRTSERQSTSTRARSSPTSASETVALAVPARRVAHGPGCPPGVGGVADVPHLHGRLVVAFDEQTALRRVPTRSRGPRSSSSPAMNSANPPHHLLGFVGVGSHDDLVDGRCPGGRLAAPGHRRRRRGVRSGPGAGSVTAAAVSTCLGGPDPSRGTTNSCEDRANAGHRHVTVGRVGDHARAGHPQPFPARPLLRGSAPHRRFRAMTWDRRRAARCPSYTYSEVRP